MRKYRVIKNIQHKLRQQKLAVVQATAASDRAGLVVWREIQLRQPAVIQRPAKLMKQQASNHLEWKTEAPSARLSEKRR